MIGGIYLSIQDLFKKTYLLTITSSIVCLLLGVLLLLKTTITLSAIAVVLGIVLILIGFSMVFRYFSDGAMRYLFGYSLLYAILDIVMGFIMISSPDSIILLIAVFTSVTLMIEFISKIQLGMILKNVEINNWIYEVIIGILLLFAAIILISNPIRGTLTLTKVMGLLIIATSIVNICDCICLKIRLKDIKKQIKDILK